MKTMILAVLLALPALSARAVEPGAPAPSLSAAGAWLNGGRAPAAADLAGRPVVLYFWSFACARCLLQVHDIQRIEAAGGPELFLGVHSGRTPRERDAKAIRDAVIGQNVTHATADDSDGRLAALFRVTRLPTTLLLGPDGKVAARWDDAAPADALRAELARVRAENAPQGALAAGRPPATALERDAQPEPQLLWPQGLAAHGDRLYVSDTGRSRILAVDRAGRVVAAYGSGARGYADGDAAAAMFDRPGALWAGPGELLVADRGTGLVRRVDLSSRKVTSLHLEALRLPTGLAAREGDVFAAAPAADKIFWRARRGMAFSPYAGGGASGLRDGSLPSAGFAEPWALAVSSETLYVADSASAASAAIRAIDLGAAEVRTLAAGAPLARPVALAALDGALYAADAETGRVLRIEDGRATPVAEGLEGPSALAAWDGALVAAESGAGRLARVDPKTGKVTRLELSRVPKPLAGPPEPPMPPAETIAGLTAAVRAGKRAALRVRAELPEGWVLTPRSRLRWRVAEAAGPIRLESATRKGTRIPAKLPVEIAFTAPPGRSELLLEVDFYYSRADGRGAVRAKSVKVPVVIETAENTKAKTADVVLVAD